MHKLLDAYLCSKYPKIFAERTLPPTKTCMCWGFPDDGWFFLIDALCRNIQSYIDNNNEWIEKYGKPRLKDYPEEHEFLKEKLIPIPQVVALQVKEKFGGLRFYYSGGDDRIAGMVSFAEDLSYSICEKCGKMDEFVNMNKKGWMKTTCPCCVIPEHKEDYTNNRNSEMINLWEKVRKENVCED